MNLSCESLYGEELSTKEELASAIFSLEDSLDSLKKAAALNPEVAYGKHADLTKGYIFRTGEILQGLRDIYFVRYESDFHPFFG